MCCERKCNQNRAVMIFVSSKFKGNFNQQHLSALVCAKRVESLNASAETSASSRKKIYARRWRERKKISVCTRRVSRRIERGPKGKEDVQKADGGRTRELKANKGKRKGTRWWRTEGKWVGQEKMSKQNAFVYLWRLSKQVTVLRWRSFWSPPRLWSSPRQFMTRDRCVTINWIIESDWSKDRLNTRGALKC